MNLWERTTEQWLALGTKVKESLDELKKDMHKPLFKKWNQHEPRLKVLFVMSTRYFQCQPKYGLFAPVHKVTRIGFPSTTPAKAKTTVRKVVATPSGLKRSPSASSVSTMSSVASSVSAKPSRTGLVRQKPIQSQQCWKVIFSSISVALLCYLFLVQLTETSSRYNRKISGTTALQEALKEKQQHIEQLMAERDMERAEVAKATGHVGEMEQEISLLREEQEQVGRPTDLISLLWNGFLPIYLWFPIPFYFCRWKQKWISCVPWLKLPTKRRWSCLISWRRSIGKTTHAIWYIKRMWSDRNSLLDSIQLGVECRNINWI